MYGMAVAYSFVETLKRAGRNLTRESLLRAATHLNHQVPFMVKGVRIQTTPRDYFPISQVRFLRYQRGYWRQFGGLVSARVSNCGMSPMPGPTSRQPMRSSLIVAVSVWTIADGRLSIARLVETRT